MHCNRQLMRGMAFSEVRLPARRPCSPQISYNKSKTQTQPLKCVVLPPKLLKLGRIRHKAVLLEIEFHLHASSTIRTNSNDFCHGLAAPSSSYAHEAYPGAQGPEDGSHGFAIWQSWRYIPPLPPKSFATAPHTVVAAPCSGLLNWFARLSSVGNACFSSSERWRSNPIAAPPG
jgi:hypothetical protein